MNAMVHTAGDELSNKFADFSAGWLKDGADDVLSFKANKIKNKKRLASVKNKSPLANRNISSIVSRIRDEGAAFSNGDAKIDKRKVTEQERQDSSVLSDKKIQSEETMSFAEACDDDIVCLSSRFNSSEVNKPRQRPSAEKNKYSKKNTVSSFSAACDQSIEIDGNIEAVKKEDSVKNKSRKKTVALIFVGLMVMFVFAYMSYQFKLQSDEMKQTLLMYKQEMNEEKSNLNKSPVVTAVAVKNKVPSLVTSAIPMVAVEEKHVVEKTTNKEVSVTTEKTVDINAKLETVIKDKKTVASVNKHAKNTMVAKPLSMKPLAISSAIKKAVVKTYVAADKPIMFTVNLASFSNRDKAYGQLAAFKSSGVIPVIEKTVVGNKTIYRLCVEGFSSREEAAWFISRLNKKHAINAWVRQS